MREAVQSPPSSAEVQNALSYNSTHPYVFMEWCLVKHRDESTLCGLLPTGYRENFSGGKAAGA